MWSHCRLNSSDSAVTCTRRRQTISPRRSHRFKYGTSCAHNSRVIAGLITATPIPAILAAILRALIWNSGGWLVRSIDEMKHGAGTSKLSIYGATQSPTRILIQRHLADVLN